MTQHKMLTSIVFVLLSSVSALTCPSHLPEKSKYSCERSASMWQSIGDLFVPHPEKDVSNTCCCDTTQHMCAQEPYRNGYSVVVHDAIPRILSSYHESCKIPYPLVKMANAVYRDSGDARTFMFFAQEGLVDSARNASRNAQAITDPTPQQSRAASTFASLCECNPLCKNEPTTFNYANAVFRNVTRSLETRYPFSFVPIHEMNTLIYAFNDSERGGKSKVDDTISLVLNQPNYGDAVVTELTDRQKDWLSSSASSSLRRRLQKGGGGTGDTWNLRYRRRQRTWASAFDCRFAEKKTRRPLLRGRGRYWRPRWHS